MSVFDSTSVERADWLKEKSLASLESAVRLVEIANAPDTEFRQAGELKGIAGDLVSRLVPMTALFHGTEGSAVRSEEWQGILERGTFALSRWCCSWGIADPHHFAESVTVRGGDDADVARKGMAGRQASQVEDRFAGADGGQADHADHHGVEGRPQRAAFLAEERRVGGEQLTLLHEVAGPDVELHEAALLGPDPLHLVDDDLPLRPLRFAGEESADRDWHLGAPPRREHSAAADHDGVHDEAALGRPRRRHRGRRWQPGSPDP